MWTNGSSGFKSFNTVGGGMRLQWRLLGAWMHQKCLMLNRWLPELAEWVGRVSDILWPFPCSDGLAADCLTIQPFK